MHQTHVPDCSCPTPLRYEPAAAAQQQLMPCPAPTPLALPPSRNMSTPHALVPPRAPPPPTCSPGRTSTSCPTRTSSASTLRQLSRSGPPPLCCCCPCCSPFVPAPAAGAPPAMSTRVACAGTEANSRSREPWARDVNCREREGKIRGPFSTEGGGRVGVDAGGLRHGGVCKRAIGVAPGIRSEERIYTEMHFNGRRCRAARLR